MIELTFCNDTLPGMADVKPSSEYGVQTFGELLWVILLRNDAGDLTENTKSILVRKTTVDSRIVEFECRGDTITRSARISLGKFSKLIKDYNFSLNRIAFDRDTGRTKLAQDMALRDRFRQSIHNEGGQLACKLFGENEMHVDEHNGKVLFSIILSIVSQSKSFRNRMNREVRTEIEKIKDRRCVLTQDELNDLIEHQTISINAHVSSVFDGDMENYDATDENRMTTILKILENIRDGENITIKG